MPALPEKGMELKENVRQLDGKCQQNGLHAQSEPKDGSKDHRNERPEERQIFRLSYAPGIRRDRNPPENGKSDDINSRSQISRTAPKTLGQ